MHLKIIINNIFFVLLLTLGSNLMAQSGPNNTFKIVIDAGHGGKDHGCSGHGSDEKDIALMLALRLGYKIQSYHHDVEVLYTRERDVFIPLFKRIDIANKSGADLFLSIHCNYVANEKVGGSETYVMGLHRADENLQVAIRENASILMEKNFEDNYEGYDPEAPESHIILSLFQDAYLEKSIILAAKIEESFKKRSNFRSRGVKQAGFVVLRKASMPSVLVEAGFLSNSKDADYLLSPEGQDEIADALAKAFTDYKNEIDQENTRVQKVVNTTPVVEVENKEIKKETVAVTIPKKETSEKPKTKVTQKNSNTEINKDALIYRVQVAATKNKPVDKTGEIWKKFEEVLVVEEDNLYKYLTGNYSNLQAALTAKIAAQEKGFKGAFIVAYKDDKRVNP